MSVKRQRTEWATLPASSELATREAATLRRPLSPAAGAPSLLVRGARLPHDRVLEHLERVLEERGRQPRLDEVVQRHGREQLASSRRFSAVRD